MRKLLAQKPKEFNITILCSASDRHTTNNIPNQYQTKLMKPILLTLAATMMTTLSHAAVIQFNLMGTAGAGLLPGNEPAVAIGGTGGEIGTGITYDNVLNLLTVNVGWGSSQGFTDLTSLASNSHIHGPTANPNGNGFTQTAVVLFNLTRSSNAVTGGLFTTPPISLTETQELALMDGKYYINIHTANNGGGEIRGFLVAAVPEPSTPLLGMLALGAVSLRRRRG